MLCFITHILLFSFQSINSPHPIDTWGILVHRQCYDWEKKRWCILEEILPSGGVTVAINYVENNTPTRVVVSPDTLVGLPLSACPNKRKHERELKKMNDQCSNKRSKGASPKEYFGVHDDYDDRGRYYIRGKLRESTDTAPLLVAGESVRYDVGKEKPSVEVLFYDGRRGGHLEVSGGKDKKKYEQYARRAEEEHAKQIRQKEHTQRRLPRSTSISFRPLQPVHVLQVGDAVIIQPPDKDGWAKVQFSTPNSTKIETKRYSDIRLIGHQERPICLDEIFRINDDVPKQQQLQSYRKDPDFLLCEWKKANMDTQFERNFKSLVEARDRVRVLAGAETGGKQLTFDVVRRLELRAKMLLGRLQEDFSLSQEQIMMESSDFRPRICEIKNMLPYPNKWLFCGGIAPEVTAYKRLRAAPLGTVILQDTDLHAVGVAVAAHPDVEFAIVCEDPKHSKLAPGDIKILLKPDIVRAVEVKLGGIHSASITNPCQSFSLAGKKEGFDSANGRLLHDCFAALRYLETSSDLPMFLAENVPSTNDINEQFNAYLPYPNANYFYACGSMCSPCIRKRKFATNRPPGYSSDGAKARHSHEPPSLNGDLPEVSAPAVLKDKHRLVHPKLKKFSCLTHSGPKRDIVWQLRGETEEPHQTSLTPEEAERAMGYLENEVGVTALTAESAVRQRIREHNFERDGCLVSLKGCADRKDLLEHVDDKRRLQLLGNSQVVTLLEALMWNDRCLFPAVAADPENAFIVEKI